jgi:hypothetical protein
MVALVATPGRFRGWRNVGLLLLRRRLSSLVEHLLFLDGVGDLGRLACEVEVLADPLLGRGAPAESIVIEGIVGFVELIA